MRELSAAAVHHVRRLSNHPPRSPISVPQLRPRPAFTMTRPNPLLTNLEICWSYTSM